MLTSVYFFVKKYKHGANSLEDATGIDIENLLNRAENLNKLAYNNFETLSEFVEAHEKLFSKRELAVLLVIYTMRTYHSYFDNQNVMYG